MTADSAPSGAEVDSVSVIVPTKNSARTIDRCLRSIREQTFQPIECIVVDNASADETVALARPLCDRLLDCGPERSAQRNAGLRAAAGTFVLFVDSDMILEPNVVAACVARAKAGAAAVAVPEESFGVGYWAECKQLERSFYHRDRLVSAARFFRRATLLGHGGYDESLVSGEDWDLSIRMAGNALAFADARIMHDEGALRLLSQARKKYYYGRHLRRFLVKHGGDGYRRINPIRSAFTKNLPRIFSRPRLGMGMVLLKTAEGCALLAGVAADWAGETVAGRRRAGT